jgi:UDP-N-acetylmuramyl pentapeptide phosphotransferase/UDP-N-acetylglucosamine-1-phosphate transferase
MPSVATAVAACLAAFALAWLLVRATLVYTLRRGLLDQPGRRRSHAVPTPRGGGLGLLLGALPWMAWAWFAIAPVEQRGTVFALLVATLLVMLAGWLDDHADRHPLARFAVHALAATLASWAVLHGLGFWPLAEILALGAALVIAIAWSINAHNFMDGIDGLLGMQALFFFVALGVLAAVLGQGGHALACGCLAAACVAFLCFNAPPARIFMGDVGSGALGLLVTALAALLWRRAPVAFWPVLILSSAFVIDATMTLLSRMLRGRRWYTAHREHLYQWLVRSGDSHLRTGIVYMLWNLLLATPAATLALHRPEFGGAVCAAVYLLAVTAWVAGKRACLVRVRKGGRGAA